MLAQVLYHFGVPVPQCGTGLLLQLLLPIVIYSNFSSGKT